MEHTELLDLILWGYLYGEKLRLDGDTRHKKLLFKTIARVHDPNIEDWNIEFLKKRLFADGFLKNADFGDEEPYELTPEGVKAAQRKHYSSAKAEQEREEKIKSLTIQSLKDSRRALIVSIFAFIVPLIISIYTIVFAKELATKEEIQNLKKEVEILQKRIELSHQTKPDKK